MKEWFPNMHKPLPSIPSTYARWRYMAKNTSTWGGESQEFKVRPGYKGKPLKENQSWIWRCTRVILSFKRHR